LRAYALTCNRERMTDKGRPVCAGAAELREWRAVRKISQRVLAGVLEVTGQLISDLECGRRIPSLETAVRIEDGTGIPPRAWVRRAA
jgi:transcriptional regulator with XRE-family HTH domain